MRSWPAMDPLLSMTKQRFRGGLTLLSVFAFAWKASAHATGLLLRSTRIRIENVSNGKYAGRALGHVLLNIQGEGVSLGANLIEHGYAYRYTGGRKRSWCHILRDTDPD